MRLAILLVLCATACRDDSCLDGTCTLPCEDVTFVTEPACVIRVDRPLFVGRVADAPPEYLLQRGHAAANDIVMTNGIVTAVIGAIDAPYDLAPTGGNLIDLGPFGGIDDMTIVYQLAGILPEDAFAYTSLEFEQRPGTVAVTVRGTLDGRPEVKVVTHYELSGCDFGIRIRSELFNGTADTHAWVIADGLHWGKRRVVPFVPAKGQGYEQPELDLLELAALWTPYDFSAGATAANDTPAYAALACDRDQLAGVNDLEISALGTPMTYVAPGDTVTLERMLIATGEGRGAAPAVDVALAARAQLFDEQLTTLSGQITAGGLAFGGDVRRASVVVYADGRPLTSVVPGNDGEFRVTVPANVELVTEVWSFGRKVASVPGAAPGRIDIPEPARVQLAITRDGQPGWATAVFTPDDDITHAQVAGTWHGRFDTCAPWLGPPHGGSPACNRALVSPQGTELEVPAGNYAIYATAGPEHTLAVEHVQLVAGEITVVELALDSLDLLPPGWLSADFHVHGRASFDSGIPDEDRVRSFVATDIDVIAATDHDVIGDYAATVTALGFDDQVAVMGGLEATQIIPWMDVPGEDLPRVIGHFNFWPLEQLPSEPRAGAPSDEYLEPGALFDRMAPLVGERGMMMMNHPWGEPQFGRDQGYLRAINFTPRQSVGDVLLRRPLGGHRNLDWNVIEIINGGDVSEMMQAKPLWLSLLAQGYIAAGAGNSDSHGLTDDQLGWARNWVQTDTTVASFSADALNEAVRDGRMIAGQGIVVLVEIHSADGQDVRGPGFTPHRLRSGDRLSIVVNAAPWIPLDELRVTTSRGTRVLAPLVGNEVERYRALIPIADLVDRDDFIIIEAGVAYPLAADLDGDGIVDTGDNDGNGVVDRDDVEEGEDIGPFVMPPDPTDPTDRRYAITRITPGAFPQGFANPLLIDVDGNDWTPPGIAP